MTDRYNALTVVLERDIRDDDAQHLMDAIRCLRGVLSVAGEVSDITAHMAQERAVSEIESKVWKALRGES
jgi:hypothetical protein